jgi:1-acyl-sn-glycerol-3-phosphate acyltransferase
MLPILVAVYYYTVVVLSLLLFFWPVLLLFLVTWPFDRKLWVLHRVSCWWGMFYVWTHPYWSVRVEGRELLDDGEARILCPNHQSMLDIFVLYFLHRHFKWVSKIENFRIPLGGWVMALNRYVALRRGDRASIKQMFEDCQVHLERGSSVLIFPEGTRSEDGQLQGFQGGAFTLAVRKNVAVQPIVVEGSHRAIPKGKLIARERTRVRVKVLPPIYPEGRGPKQLMQECRTAIREELARLRGVSPDEVDKLTSSSVPVP